MCSCKRHNDLSVPCTCFCEHPGDSRMTFYRKRVAVRLRYARHEVDRRVMNAQMTIANKLPRWVAYWCFVRVSAEASYKMPNREFPGITVTEAAEVWAK